MQDPAAQRKKSRRLEDKAAPRSRLPGCGCAISKDPGLNRSRNRKWWQLSSRNVKANARSTHYSVRCAACSSLPCGEHPHSPKRKDSGAEIRRFCTVAGSRIDRPVQFGAVTKRERGTAFFRGEAADSVALFLNLWASLDNPIYG